MHVLSDSNRRLMALPDVCRRLGRSYHSIYNAVLSGKLPAEHIRGRWWVDVEAVEELEQRGSSAASDESSTAKDDPAHVTMDVDDGGDVTA